MHPMLNIAVKAARRAGGIINRASRNLDVIAVREKAANDFVSEVDREAEQAIIRTLHEAYPNHSILAEESGASGSSEFQWIIDPLDGTTNFLHGLPQYAVSIALAQKGVITQAVVYDPNRNDLYTATKGRGAFLNETRLRVSKHAHLKPSLIGTGFPYRQLEHLEPYLGMMRDIIKNTAGLRRPGSASLDLRLLGAGPEQMGHCRRQPADHRGRGPRRRPAGQRPVSRQRQHRCRQSQGVRPAAAADCPPPDTGAEVLTR